MSIDIKKSDIDNNLSHLINDLDTNLVSVTNITSIFSSNINKGIYKLIFEDGRVLKWRKFEAQYDAERVYSLWKYLNPYNFPNLIKRYETSMLIEWVEGVTLSAEKIPLNTYRRCGELLGKIHTTSLTTDEIEKFTKYTPRNVKECADLIDGYISNLFSHGTINDKELDILKKLVRKYTPQNFKIGLVLGDFCPENMVTTKTGDICIIDNETLAIDSLDYDLARTFYHWPMISYQKEAFLKGYEIYRSVQSYNSHCYFWDLRVLSKSILHRTRTNTETVSVPIKQLRTLLQKF